MQTAVALPLGRTGRKHLKKRQQFEQDVATEQQTIKEATFAAVKLLLRGCRSLRPSVRMTASCYGG